MPLNMIILFRIYAIVLNEIYPSILDTNEKHLGTLGSKKTTIYKHGTSVIKESCTDPSNEVIIQSIQQEILFMTQFKHPNIIKGIDKGMTEKQYRLLFDGHYTEYCYSVEMDYYPNDLVSFINNWRFEKQLKNFQIMMRTMMYQILSALKYLHSHGYAHLDIKPDNIYIKQENDLTQIVLADLESVIQKKYINFENLIATPAYLPPEINENETINAQMVDIFQLGATLGKILLTLFKQGYDQNLPLSGDSKDFRMLEHKIDANMLDLLRKMTTRDLNNRITAIDALNHEWFKGEHTPTTGVKRKADSFEFRTLATVPVVTR
eukprot:NODE_151_length_15465_cov_0.405376.p6 type:complete len:321 gc:universal NODE_151_length_15465_cov_0.405376:7769-6807(-)